jgi:hypothetical protein
VPFDQWWNVVVERKFKDFDGTFIHPVSDPAVIAGKFLQQFYIFLYL